MRYVLILCLAVLCGCSQKTPVEAIADNATTQIVALEKNLAPECKTPGIMVQIAAIKGEIARAPQACELQIKPIRTQRNALAIALIAIVGLFIARIVRKVAI